MVDSAARNPEEQMLFDAQTPDVCRHAHPPNNMTPKRAAMAVQHFLFTAQQNMCKCPVPLSL